METMKPLNKKALLVRPQMGTTLFSDFLDSESSMLRHTLISGGTQRDRSAIEYYLMQLSRKTAALRGEHLPVIVLHMNNPRFIQRNQNEGTVDAFPPQSALSFAGMNDREIVEVLSGTLSAQSKDSAYPSARELLTVGIELLRLSGKEVSLFELAQLPWTELRAYVDELRRSGRLNQEEVFSYNSRINSAAEVSYSVEELFDRLKMEGAVRKENNGDGVFLAVKRGGVCFINLVSGERCWEKAAVLQQIRLVALRGIRFLMVLDSTPVSTGDDVMESLLINNTHFSWIIASEDIPAKYNAFFERLTGGNNNVVLFSHASGKSAQAWSDYLGQAYAIKKTVTSGQSRENLSLFKGQVSKSETQEMERRYRIPPEWIQELNMGETLISAGQALTCPAILDFASFFNVLMNQTSSKKMISG